MLRSIGFGSNYSETMQSSSAATALAKAQRRSASNATETPKGQEVGVSGIDQPEKPNKLGSHTILWGESLERAKNDPETYPHLTVVKCLR